MTSDPNVSTGLYDFVAWLEVNKKPLIAAVVGLFLVGSAVYVYRWMQDQNERNASEALLLLRPPARADDSTNNPDPGEYEKLAEEYSGTDAAERAEFLAAGALFEKGKYAEAQAQFNKVLESSDSSLMAPQAAYGAAASLEGLGQRDQALTAYEQVAQRYPDAAVSEKAKLAMARIHEAKNEPEAALKIYDELIRPNAPGANTAEIVRMREQLLSAHPELRRKIEAEAQANLSRSAVSTNAVMTGTNAGAALTNAVPAGQH